MKKSSVLIIFCLSLAISGYSQNKKSLELGWGYGHLSRQDISFSPMIHKKWSPANVYANYEIAGDKMTHLINLKFNAHNTSIIEPFEFYWEEPNDSDISYRHNFKQVELNYSFNFPVHQTDKFKLSIGGRQRNRLVASEYYYAISSSFSYYFSFGLDASIHMNYEINEMNKLSASVNASLFAFNSRSPYLGFDDNYLEDNYSHKGFNAFLNYIGNAELQSFGNAQDFDLKTSYEKILSEKWSLTGTYYLGLNFNQSPTTFATIRNTFSLGGKLKF